MKILAKDFVENLYETCKEKSLFGKWITLGNIEPLYKKHQEAFQIQEIGTSEFGKPIYSVTIGNGKMKILLWSQMHGNESTATKALFDLFNCFLDLSSKEIITILKNCTLVFIPMLNPDGSQAYTRVNGKDIDLNRDAVDRKAKESK